MKHLLHTLMGCLLLVATTACEKDTLAEVFAPQIETGVADNIYRKGATLSGSIQYSEGMTIDSYGIHFSEIQGMDEYEQLEVTDGAKEFRFSIQNLVPGKTYYFCTYVHSGYSTVRSEVRSFTTTKNNPPIFDYPVVTGVDETSFTITSTLIDDGGSELILSGFCYNVVGGIEPTFMDHVANVEVSGNALTATVTGLEPSTTYQVRAYGASNNGLGYSGMVTVTTKAAAN